MENVAKYPTLWKADVLNSATDRFERRLSEELGGLRLEIAAVNVRMAEGQNMLLRWLFGFVITVLAANFGMTTVLLNAITR